MPLHGWHKGEQAIQQKMGCDDVMSQAWTWIQPEMSEQHQTFYTTRLPFIPVTTIDDDGRPWASILAGPDGRPGFASSGNLGELTLNARVWEGDPFPRSIRSSGNKRPVLVAGIGVEFSTRRRNKFAGYIEALESDGPMISVRSVVNEAIGNCPKYINVRDLVPFPDTRPHVIHRRRDLSPGERLPDDVISFIQGSDTLFLGTYYDAGEDHERFPSHVGMNQRGGKPGFARVRPSDGRTLVIPDYSGNRLLTSLGNIEATPLAGVTFVSFETGSILYLTGDAFNHVGPSAQRLMPRINGLTTLHVTGYTLVEDALPVRQRVGTEAQRSPYSPPVRLLAEEMTSTYFVDDAQERPQVMLTQIQIHSPDVATFTFESPTPVTIVPGQAAILDFKSFVGELPYQHMAPGNPSSVNDDRIRTWTVSGSSHWAGSPSEGTRTARDARSLFRLTMRLKPGGVVTGALFTIAHQLSESRPELLEDARPMQLSVPLVGIAGDFTLPADADTCSSELARQGSCAESSAQPDTTRRWLWIAGGIGVTPFLAMLAGLRERDRSGTRCVDDIVLILSTREPDVLLPLVLGAWERTAGRVDAEVASKLTIHVFSRSAASRFAQATKDVEVRPHTGRLDEDALRDLNIERVRERQAYVCGPEDFERAVLSALKEMGIDPRGVRREGFAY